MTQQDVNNWIMYHEIQKLHRLGFKKARIARYLVMDPRTVGKYLQMNEEEFEHFLLRSQERKKVLSPYEDFIKDQLSLYHDTSAAQIHDWLKERFEDLPEVSPRTVYNFVMYVRRKHNIPVVSQPRIYFPVEELPYGQQAQMDFGEYNMRCTNGKRQKVRFFTMVLARSRMKYVWFRKEPFTGETVSLAHEHAFAFFGGIPETIVYDLDRTMVVDENMGDIMLTATFKQYTRARSFNLHFCRKADPESKGKVENVVQYVKKNFLYNRVFSDIKTLNNEALAWLERTANHLIHNFTKKSPIAEHIMEKKHLNPYTPITVTNHETPLYQVRKDNTIAYQSNFYSLPAGTYQGSDTKVIVRATEHNTIDIYSHEEVYICSHECSSQKGKHIINTHHKRDNTQSLDNLINQLSGYFSDQGQAAEYFRRIREKLPRYSRDHFQAILTSVQQGSNATADRTLAFCLKNQIFHGPEFQEVFVVFEHEQDSSSEKARPDTSISLLNPNSLDKAHQSPEKSNPEDYEDIINP